MIWSFSESKRFNKCQRQWYFKNLFASATSSEPARREAYLLGKIQTLAAVRGQVIDDVISNYIIPAVKHKESIGIRKVVAIAESLFDSRIEFARTRPVSRGISPNEVGGEWAALFPFENGAELSAEEIGAARSDIRTAILNLFGFNDLRELIKRADHLLAQRPLTIRLDGISIRCVPDLIALFRDDPPVVLDWKVHFSGNLDASIQLGIYALALSNAILSPELQPFKTNWKWNEFRLLEVQLLLGRIREHHLFEDEGAQIRTLITQSFSSMTFAMGDEPVLKPESFPVTRSPEACIRCPYRGLCCVEVA